MNWRVFKRDNKDTWPNIDCPMVVYNELLNKLYICKWDSNINKFFEEVDSNKKLLHNFKECFYANISSLPFLVRASYPVRCMNSEYWCDDEDDGYCMLHNSGCKYANTAEEYLIGSKPIWKEF